MNLEGISMYAYSCFIICFNSILRLKKHFFRECERKDKIRHVARIDTLDYPAVETKNKKIDAWMTPEFEFEVKWLLS